ncbi:MAG: hypothetical protein CVV53_03860 [Spirochaetae bacterium HGW-Spirochaetae-9]|nr:MAG: hypothetical protein CVV53_03860 [Spirochaetae bacterium HGW-Spirochaetae-9]
MRSLLFPAVLAACLALPLQSQGLTPARSLTFSDYKWDIRHTVEPEGPMGNQFGGDARTTVLNADGSLTLSIEYKDGVWRAGEVTTQKNLGYGTYLFKLRTPPSRLDPRAVLGLFTYSRSAAYSHREIDIELSAWGRQDIPVYGQFVIQPWDVPGQLSSFDILAIEAAATYAFTWSEGRVDFATWKGYGQWPQPGSPELISAWTFIDAKAVPKPSSKVHINLYLAEGTIPPLAASGDPSLSVTIDAFEFIQAKK